jgi:hypothetical protein
VGLARLSVAPFAATLLKGATSVGEIADVASRKDKERIVQASRTLPATPAFHGGRSDGLHGNTRRGCWSGTIREAPRSEPNTAITMKPGFSAEHPSDLQLAKCETAAHGMRGQGHRPPSPLLVVLTESKNGLRAG